MSLDASVWAWKQSCAKSSSKLVLLSLADRAGADFRAYPSIETLSYDTELNRKTVIAALKHLVELGLIRDTGERKGPTNRVVVYELIGVVGRDTQPKSKPRRMSKASQSGNSTENGTIPNLDSNSPKNGTSNSPKIGTQNQSVEPITEPSNKNKAQMLESRFESFYSKYPNKKSKAQARKVFEKINPDDLLLQKIIRALRAQIENRECARAAGVWIPEWKHPSTWLNGQCWEDSLIDIPVQTAAQPYMGGPNYGTAATHRSAPAAGAKLSTVDRQHAAAAEYLAQLEREAAGPGFDGPVVASYE